MTTPLVNQVLLNWLVSSYMYARLNDEERQALGVTKPQGPGYGIGLAFDIFAMKGNQLCCSLISIADVGHSSEKRLRVWYVTSIESKVTA